MSMRQTDVGKLPNALRAITSPTSYLLPSIECVIRYRSAADIMTYG